MVGWTLLLAVFAVMILFALSVVITARRQEPPDELDRQD